MKATASAVERRAAVLAARPRARGKAPAREAILAKRTTDRDPVPRRAPAKPQENRRGSSSATVSGGPGAEPNQCEETADVREPAGWVTPRLPRGASRGWACTSATLDRTSRVPGSRPEFHPDSERSPNRRREIGGGGAQTWEAAGSCGGEADGRILRWRLPPTSGVRGEKAVGNVERPRSTGQAVSQPSARSGPKPEGQPLRESTGWALAM